MAKHNKSKSNKSPGEKTHVKHPQIKPKPALGNKNK